MKSRLTRGNVSLLTLFNLLPLAKSTYVYLQIWNRKKKENKFKKKTRKQIKNQWKQQTTPKIPNQNKPTDSGHSFVLWKMWKTKTLISRPNHALINVEHPRR